MLLCTVSILSETLQPPVLQLRLLPKLASIVDSLQQLSSFSHRFPLSAVFTSLFAMPGVQLFKLLCLTWPDDDPIQHIVEVQINDDETVATLKQSIKAMRTRTLGKVNARDLVLWRCSIPDDDNLRQTMNAVHFDVHNPDLKCLRPASLLSRCFDIPSSPDFIRVLVEVPALGEYGAAPGTSRQSFSVFLHVTDNRIWCAS